MTFAQRVRALFGERPAIDWVDAKGNSGAGAAARLTRIAVTEAMAARLFQGTTWNFLCLEAELPGRNTYKRSHLGDMPVVVTRELVIVGGTVLDNVSVNEQSGVIRARSLRPLALSLALVLMPMAVLAQDAPRLIEQEMTPEEFKTFLPEHRDRMNKLMEMHRSMMRMRH